MPTYHPAYAIVRTSGLLKYGWDSIVLQSASPVMRWWNDVIIITRKMVATDMTVHCGLPVWLNGCLQHSRTSPLFQVMVGVGFFSGSLD